MNLRLLAFVLLATRLTAVDVWFTSAPSSVPHGQSYYVEAAAYDGSGTDVWVHKAGGWFAYNWAAGDRAGGWSADSGPQTIDYLGEALGWSDSTWGYVYTCVTIDGAAPPPNQPPSAWVEVDGHGHTATLTRPYGGAVHVTVRYKAADADGNLARIRPQVWHPGSGYFSNDGGGWTGQSGGSGEVVRTVTLDQDGDWYFWTDAEDAPGVFVNSGAWGDGFRLHVVQGTPPNQAPVTHSISGTNPALGSATTLTGHATDADGNLAWMHFYVGGPGLAAGWNYLGSAAIAGGSATAALHWTPPQQGTYAIHLRAEDTNGVYDSNANVTGSFSVGAPPDTTPPGTPHNLQVSGLTASSFTLAWSAPSDNVGVTGYRVRLNEGSFTEVGNVLSHTFSGLAANTSYGAQVSARDAAGNWSGWAGAGATTGSSGGGGPQASDSVWRHIIGGDGILDEIVRAGTGEFNFYVNEWYTTNYSYSYFPVNNQWHWWRIFWEQSVYEENFTSSWEYSHQFWVFYETFFELAFEISINYNHPFRIYRDRSASEQINLGDWELLINTVGSPGGFTMISYPIYDPADLPGAQYFMVKQGYAINSVSVQGANGASGVTAGGTASVTLPANGQLMITVHDPLAQEIPIEAGKHSLTWILEKVVNGVTHAINGVGKLIDVSPILPLPNGQILLKLKLDNSDQYFTFVLVLPNTPPAASFDGMWETKNKANQLFNATQKDDPWEGAPGGNGAPRNTLYVVTDPLDGKFRISLSLNVPAQHQGAYLVAAYTLDNFVYVHVPGSDRSVSAQGIANMEFAPYAPAGANQRKDFVIRTGYDADNDDYLDDNEVIQLSVGEGWGEPTVRGIDQAAYADSKGYILGGITVASVWPFNMAVPHATEFVRIFQDGGIGGVLTGYEPTATNQNVSFNAFSGEFSEWLTHNSGAVLDDNGATTLTEYIWDNTVGPATNSTCELLAASPQLTQAVTNYYNSTVAAIAGVHFSSTNPPVGTQVEFPLNPNEAYNIPHTHQSPGWVSPTTMGFHSPNSIADDLYYALGRGRLLTHRVRYRVEKQAGGLVVTNVYAEGEVIDLYDFNHDSGILSKHAATLQIGHGKGAYTVTTADSNGRDRGKIFRVRIKFKKDYPSLP